MKALNVLIVMSLMLSAVFGEMHASPKRDEMHPFGTERPEIHVTSLAIDPHDPRVIYAGTEKNGLFKSTNAGGSWTSVSAGIPDEWICALTIDPSDPAILYAATPGGGVFKSTDAGENWQSSNSGF